MNKNKYYELLNDFAIRIPALPFSNYRKFEDENFINDAINDSYFIEAIKIASPSLYDSIKRQKIDNSVIKAIIKYYSRISTRTTPFGLFSGISIGKFNENTTINYDENNFNKRIRVDYEWLVKLIKKIEIDYKLYRNLSLYTSRNIFEYGNKIENPIITCFNYYKSNESYQGKCYINNKNNIKFILNMLKSGARYDDIQSAFKKKKLKIDDSILDNLIEGLIKNEYIYTEIRPNINDYNYLDYIINIMEINEVQIDILNELKKINSLIKEYNSLRKTDGISILDEIQSLMKNIHESKSYIQVDLVLSLIHISEPTRPVCSSRMPSSA